MSVFICDKDTLAVFDIFLAGFYGSHKVKLFTSMNLRNGSFLKPFNKLAVRVLSGIKHLAIVSCLYT